MTPNKTSRGRPKGTGLNDAAQLRAIAELMISNPDLKPTTAIKKLEINDPSVIRRLRDKYHAAESALLAELKSGKRARDGIEAAPQTPVSPPLTAEPTKTPARVVALTAAEEPRKSMPAPRLEPMVVELSAVRKRRPDGIKLPSETELPNWMGVSLSLFALSFEAQFAMAGLMLQYSPFASMVRSQIAYTDLAVAYTRKSVASVSA